MVDMTREDMLMIIQERKDGAYSYPPARGAKAGVEEKS